jgi:type IV secretion system protein VirB5
MEFLFDRFESLPIGGHMPTKISLCSVVIILAAMVPGPVCAQWAVIDAPAIVQLVQQVQTMEQAVQTARDQLSQARLTLKTMTGDRGMGLLLRGTPRNYLPSNWAQLSSVMQGGGALPGISADVRSAVNGMAVLTPQQLSTLSADGRQQVIAARRTNAVRLALAQEALANTSARFASIQSLIGAISTAGDQKAILDLQARISAELGMLQNEQTKLQVLQQATDAQAALDRQRDWEQAVAGQGRFESRFQPRP